MIAIPDSLIRQLRCACLGVFLLGGHSMFKAQKEGFPTVDLNTITVTELPSSTRGRGVNDPIPTRSAAPTGDMRRESMKGHRQTTMRSGHRSR